MTIKEVSKMLEDERVRRGLSYREVADKVGSNPTAVRRLCIDGKGRLHLILAVSRVLGFKLGLKEKS